MEKTDDFFEFEGDFRRDTATYRFIELSEAAITTAFEEDENLAGRYFTWLSEEKEEKRPLLLYEFSLEKEESVQIFALPNAKEFFIRFKTGFFEACVSILYDIETMNTDVARVVIFSGEVFLALSWAEALHATWDDILFNLMNSKGNSL